LKVFWWLLAALSILLIAPQNRNKFTSREYPLHLNMDEPFTWVWYLN
jgi:hypothetical protein